MNAEREGPVHRAPDPFGISKAGFLIVRTRIARYTA